MAEAAPGMAIARTAEQARQALWGRKARVFTPTSKPQTIDSAFPHNLVCASIGINHINKASALCLRTPRSVYVKDATTATGMDPYFLFQVTRGERLGFVRMSATGAVQPVHIVQALYYGGPDIENDQTIVCLGSHFYPDNDPVDPKVITAVQKHARKFADAVHGFEAAQQVQQMVPGGSKQMADIGCADAREDEFVKKSWMFSVVANGLPLPPNVNPHQFGFIFRRMHRLAPNPDDHTNMKVFRSHELQLVSATKKPLPFSHFVGAFRQMPFEQPPPKTDE